MADAGAGHAGDAPGQPALGLQHGGGGAAAAVAVAEALQHVPGQVLVLEALPAAHDLFGVQQAVVGGVEVGAGVQVGVGVVVFGGDEVGQHLGAVDAPPAGQVVGHAVGVVPGQLGGHEPAHPALLHDLGQCAAEAEGVGQPEDVAGAAEFPLEKALAVEELADQAFPRGHVAVGFQPHAAFRLPAALGHPGADLFIQRRAVPADKVVELGLAGEEEVFGVAVHQVVDGGKAADGLFPGLGQGPQPGHVDVGVAHAGFGDRGLAADPLVKLGAQVLPGGGDAAEERLAARAAQVQQRQGPVQAAGDGQGVGVAGILQGHRLKGGLEVVVQGGDLVLPHGGLHPQEDILGGGVAVGVQPQLPAVAGAGAGGQVELGVVDVQPADQLAVEVGQELGVVVVPDVGGAGGHQADQVPAGGGGRGGHRAAEAEVGFLAADGVAGGEGGPAGGVLRLGEQTPAVVGGGLFAQRRDRGAAVQAAGLQGLQDGRQAVAQFVGLQHGDLPL